MLKTFSEGISTGENFGDVIEFPGEHLPPLGKRDPELQKIWKKLAKKEFKGSQREIKKRLIKVKAKRLAKHLISKEGLKLTAKIAARIAGKFLKVLSAPYLWPIIWSPEIVDIATSKDVQKVWKNMKSEKWWKEAKKRDVEARKRVKAGKEPFSELSPSIPQGEYFHKDKGWY